ncbi:MAG: prepilin-type N-terminal cleavage/methylation domain-containing protein [Candidatus Daviesbacteria bacterium]|nr:MAG: prepilin-type N-terminal cleavage/methylation domain-containing protein [Candidatus Daviesbacteria bacterium]
MSKGFTLIELLVVISIIGILSSIGIVSYSTILKNSRDARRQSDIKAIQSALEQYRADHSFYPTSLNLSSLATIDSNSGNPNPQTNNINVYLNNTPVEPSLNSSYPYLYSALPANCNNIGTKCSSYCIYAKLENSVSKASQCSDKPFTCNANSSNCYTLKATIP